MMQLFSYAVPNWLFYTIGMAVGLFGVFLLIIMFWAIRNIDKMNEAQN